MNQVQSNKPSVWAKWRTIDLVTVAIIAVALGVAFWGYDTFVWPWVSAITAGYPPLGELQLGVWILPAVIGALLVRKPGAALLAELIAANVELLLGNTWGPTVMISGICQGVGVEVIFLVFAYKRFGPMVAALGGALSALFEVIYEFYSYVPDYSVANKTVYLVAGLLSGALISGLGGWALLRSLASTGVLGAFAVGRK